MILYGKHIDDYTKDELKVLLVKAINHHKETFKDRMEEVKNLRDEIQNLRLINKC